MAVALVSEPTQASVLVNPVPSGSAPPNRTVALAHADTLPAASRARARTTCWPAA